MEDELRDHLLRCAGAYAEARGISLTTVARLAAGDWRFFERLGDDAKTFTARKYDEVMAWLSANWPAETAWPVDVPRPAGGTQAIVHPATVPAAAPSVTETETGGVS